MTEPNFTPPAEQPSPPRRGRNPFFPLVAIVSVVFIITILALVSIVFGNPEAPIAKWLDRNGGRLIGAEILIFVAVSVAALVVDRRQTLRNQQQATPLAPDVRSSDSP